MLSPLGVLNWISLNFLLDSRDDDETVTTLVLDESHFHIALEIPKHLKHKFEEVAVLTPLRHLVFGVLHNHQVYAHTYHGYGLHAMRNRILEKVWNDKNNNMNGNSVIHPCLASNERQMLPPHPDQTHQNNNYGNGDRDNNGVDGDSDHTQHTERWVIGGDAGSSYDSCVGVVAHVLQQERYNRNQLCPVDSDPEEFRHFICPIDGTPQPEFHHLQK